MAGAQSSSGFCKNRAWSGDRQKTSADSYQSALYFSTQQTFIPLIRLELDTGASERALPKSLRQTRVTATYTLIIISLCFPLGCSTVSHAVHLTPELLFLELLTSTLLASGVKLTHIRVKTKPASCIFPDAR